MDELEKNLRVNRLIDLYGSLLTGHQRQILSWYYSMDLSLAEISDQLGISRNGVYDALKKGVAVLESTKKICIFFGATRNWTRISRKSERIATRKNVLSSIGSKRR